MDAPRLLKKYPNRRLYDTRISSYVTLDDVRQLVLDGEEFEVRDARSDQDITRLVLLQIIAEREEEGQPMLSATSLQLMIRFYGDPLHGFMSRYIERSLQVFLEQQHTLRKQLGGLISPYMVGKVKDVTGSASMGLYALAAALVVSCIIIAWGLPQRYYVRTKL